MSSDDGWDDWDKHAQPPTTTAVPHGRGDAAMEDRQPLDAVVATHRAQTLASSVPSTTADAWHWDWAAMERDVAALAPGNPVDEAMPSHDATNSREDQLWRVAVAADQAKQAIDVHDQQLATLWGLAAVNQLQLLLLRNGALAGDGDAWNDEPTISGLKERLRQMAGDWGDASLWHRTVPGSKQTELAEMSALLRGALATVEDGDLAPFQQVLEQVFASANKCSITIPVTWTRPATNAPQDAHTAFPYLGHVLALAASGDNAFASTLRPLSEAEKFQDSKDIRRDEVLVNGKLLAGSIGYPAIIQAIHDEVDRQLTAVHLHKATELTELTHLLAAQVLNACNRTESGGCSYETLSTFVTANDMNHVLIRPASAKASPLTIEMDVGPFVESGRHNEEWNFGLRVRLSAATWYLLCDAQDPACELAEIEATYRNQLAFPLQLTAFHPPHQMRKDHGHVHLRLVKPMNAGSPMQSPRVASPVSTGVETDINFENLL
ncbi:TPA: hypothetical protein N0F65_005397 [Lagenidium giganteum]|uniref:Uncharacterized protein n=1 Tax=Lagenidium giganteum TaxID=4803 RepID=A0AAV2YZE0_9STRA|nr:TPA: hypothetical protein N0F65_005397 [Lagenidium giganteum]